MPRKLTTNNNDDRLMINWHKINVAAAPRQNRFFFFFFFSFISICIRFADKISLHPLYYNSGPAFISWRLDDALR